MVLVRPKASDCYMATREASFLPKIIERKISINPPIVEFD
jgi:hypothetical protein